MGEVCQANSYTNIVNIQDGLSGNIERLMKVADDEV